MQKIIAERIVEAIENNDGEARIYENYSGRGMYGKTTTGVVVENGDLVSSIILCAELFIITDTTDDELLEAIENITQFKSDHMGLGTIYY